MFTYCLQKKNSRQEKNIYKTNIQFLKEIHTIFFIFFCKKTRKNHSIFKIANRELTQNGILSFCITNNFFSLFLKNLAVSLPSFYKNDKLY